MEQLSKTFELNMSMEQTIRLRFEVFKSGRMAIEDYSSELRIKWSMFIVE